MRDATTRRIKPGVVVEIETPRGLAYFPYVRRDPHFGALIRVLPGIYSERPESIERLAASPERFQVFFPLGAAVRRGIVKPVGSVPIPAGSWRERPMRRPGAITREGLILTWVISEGGRDRVVRDLSAEETKLSIQGIVNDTMLIERIASDWRPEDWI